MPDESPNFIISLLDTKKHERAAFSCGEPSLDTYLQRQASQDIKRRAAVVHVMTESEETIHIMGYYTLSAASVKLTDIPEAEQKKLARYPYVAASLLGRLAVDEQHKGRGLGGQLLRHALLRTLAQSEEVAIAVVIVDALNESAQQFYERYGFTVMPNQENRLYIPMATVERSLSKSDE